MPRYAPNKLDLSGLRFGKLVVLKSVRPGTNGDAVWSCQCDCGKVVERLRSSLRRSANSNCGCYKTKHGYTINRQEKPELKAYYGMFERCERRSRKDFDRWGGRGIVICKRWRDSFLNFIADMGDRPSTKHSLDRIDNDDPYSPENCRWATKKTQANNRTTSRKLTMNGETLTMMQWSEKLHIRYSTIQQRLKYGWSHDRALRVRSARNKHSCKRLKYS